MNDCLTFQFLLLRLHRGPPRRGARALRLHVVPPFGDGGRGRERPGGPGGDAEPAVARHGRRPGPDAEPRDARDDAPGPLPARPRPSLQRGQ